MSRELKFRVWSDDLKKYVTTIDLKRTGETFLSICDTARAIKYLNDIGVYDFQIEQYTGDKDQYNTPICEGDIIRICETDIGEVLQDYDGRWIIVSIPKEKLRGGDSVLLGDLEKLQKWCLADILSKEYCSVIGNIHENPELLEN